MHALFLALDNGHDSWVWVLFQIHRYYAGATDGEVTLRDNRDVWGRYRLLPTMMRDVSNIDISTDLLGTAKFCLGVIPLNNGESLRGIYAVQGQSLGCKFSIFLRISMQQGGFRA